MVRKRSQKIRGPIPEEIKARLMKHTRGVEFVAKDGKVYVRTIFGIKRIK